MADVKIVLNSDGVKELLQSGEMMATVVGLAEKVAAAAGEGFTPGSFTGYDRAHAFVMADSKEAVQACFDDNVLLKALGQ